MLRNAAQLITLAAALLVLEHAVAFAPWPQLGYDRVTPAKSGWRCAACSTGARRSVAAMMAGGPNKGKPASAFASWEVLEAELRCYLQERAAGPPAESVESSRNPVLAFLSVDPKAIKDPFAEIDADEREWVGEPDALSYSELTKYGYKYLIEPMMDQGGYVTVSERMGVTLNPRRTVAERKYSRPELSEAKQELPKEGFLALGSALTERIDAAAEMDVVALKRSKEEAVFARQASMGLRPKRSAGAATANAPATTATRSMDPAVPIYKTAAKPVGEADLEAEAEELVGRKGEPLMLSVVQRVYIVLAAFAAALGFGHGTAEAVARGLPADVPETARYAAEAFAAANVASAAFSAALAGRKQRSAPLWLFKGALTGPLGVLELQSAAQIEDEL